VSDFAYPRLFVHVYRTHRDGCPPVEESDGDAERGQHLCGERIHFSDPSTQQTHYWTCTRPSRIGHFIHVACDRGSQVVVARWSTIEYIIHEEVIPE
jgi:hypothetical protein